MKPLLASTLCAIALLILAPVRAAEAAVAPKLEPIFNGHDLTGWKDATNNRFWRAENGVLIGESDAKLAGNYLWTEKNYGDFVLEFDVRWKGEIDSGVEFRKPSIQLQLGVSRSLKRDMSGSFYIGKEGYPPAAQAKDAARLMKPEGEWNTFRLEARGTTFTAWINGTKAVEYTNPKFAAPAPLGLQIHPGLKMKVEYRNLRAADLP
jgi:hypothetical protein